jgi:hypothetical protein
MGAKRKGGGGKLSRTETVTVRLDPKLKFAAELAARRHRRTLSSFIEWAVEEASEKVVVGLKENETAKYVMADVWSVNEVDRFFKFAQKYPHLLTHDEEVLWEAIVENTFIWKFKNDKSGGLEDDSLGKLKLMWAEFKEYAKGEKTFNEINELSEEIERTTFY